MLCWLSFALIWKLFESIWVLHHQDSNIFCSKRSKTLSFWFDLFYWSNNACVWQSRLTITFDNQVTMSYFIQGDRNSSMILRIKCFPHNFCGNLIHHCNQDRKLRDRDVAWLTIMNTLVNLWINGIKKKKNKKEEK